MKVKEVQLTIQRRKGKWSSYLHAVLTSALDSFNLRTIHPREFSPTTTTTTPTLGYPLKRRLGGPDIRSAVGGEKYLGPAGNRTTISWLCSR